MTIRLFGYEIVIFKINKLIVPILDFKQAKEQARAQAQDIINSESFQELITKSKLARQNKG